MEELDPQAVQAQLLRRALQAKALQDANANAHQFDTLAAVSQMANNPGVAQAAKIAQTNAQGRYKPLSLGAQGFALPASGDFVASPIYEDQKNSDRLLRQTLADQTAAQQKAETERKRENDQQRALFQTALLGMRGSNADLQRQLLEARIEATRERGSNAKTKELDQQLTKYTNAIEKGNIPAIDTGLKKISGIFEKYQTGDIPGFGAVTNMLPDMMVSDEGKNNRVDMQLTANQILRGLSGQAVTGQENQRFLTAVGRGAGMTAEQLRRGWANVYEEINSKKRNLNSMLSPDAMAEYRNRGGADYTDYELPAWAKPFMAKPAAAGDAPAGVPADVWKHMTPQEKALWKK